MDSVVLWVGQEQNTGVLQEEAASLSHMSSPGRLWPDLLGDIMTLQPNGDPSAISGSLAFSSYKPSFEEAGETREVSGLPVASVATAPPPGGLYSTLVLWDHGSILRGKKLF